MFGDLDAGWLWAIAGVVLLIAEVVAPGFFLVFIGAAALATGLFTVLFDLGLAPQIGLFVVYSAVFVMIFISGPDGPAVLPMRIHSSLPVTHENSSVVPLAAT